VPENPGSTTHAAQELEERYVRGEILGRGSHGVVYRARDRIIERDVALKVLKFDAASSESLRREMVVRSEREARPAGFRRSECCSRRPSAGLDVIWGDRLH
jgi:hypothetical protein